MKAQLIFHFFMSALDWPPVPTSRRQLLLIAVLVVGIRALAAPGSSEAAAFTVNSTLDAVDASPGDGACATAAGECTLRAAVQETNALPGANVITLPAGLYPLSIRGAFDEIAAAGDVDVTGELEINGAGAAVTVIDGGFFSSQGLADIAFHVHQDATVLISGVTVQAAGHILSSGGGILNQGSLTLDRSILKENSAHRGAGIRNFGGALTVTRSSFIDNLGGTGSASGAGILSEAGGTMTLTEVEFIGNGVPGIHGGAITNAGAATLIRVTLKDNFVGVGVGGAIYNGVDMTIIDSTISGNNVGPGQGGGIFNESTATLVVSNTTVSGNRGGAIYNEGNATLNNVTITENSASEGGGLYHGDSFGLAGALTVTNTILANNYGIVTGEAGGDCGGPSVSAIISGGHNLSSDGTCPFSGPGDLTNTDPLLGPLSDNGGPTETHALLAGSPAIDAGGNAACPDRDQRGFLRPADGDGDGDAVCDIGAFEAGARPPAPTLTASPTVAPPATPSATPPPEVTPTSLPSPAQRTRLPSALPRTGGAPDAVVALPPYVLALLAGGAFALALFTAAMARRSRP